MEERVYQGYVYRRAGPGEAWQMAGPAPRQGAPVGQIIRNPNAAVESQKLGLGVQAAQVGIARDNVGMAKDSAELPYVAPRAAAEVSKAQTDAQAAQIALDLKRAEVQAAPDPAVAKSLRGLGQDEILGAIQTAGGEIGGLSTGLPGQVLSGIWGTGANNLAGSLNTIGSGLTLEKLGQMKAQSSTGASGLGALSEREGAMLRDSVASIGQNQGQDKLRDSLSKIELHYRRYRALLDGGNPDDPEVAKKYGIAVAPPESMDRSAPPPTDGPQREPAQGLTADGQYVDRAGTKGANARVAAMIRGGSSEKEIRGYLNSVQPGLGDTVESLPEAIAWSRQNPGKSVGVDVEKQWQPATGVSRAIGNVGMSPFGAAVIGSADMMTAGTLDNLTGDPAKARAVIGGVQEMNPNAYLMGQVAGGVGSGLGMEAGLGRAGLGAVGRMRAGDAALGAAYGAGTADEPSDSRSVAALLGAGVGLAGGALGRGASRTAGRLTAGVRDDAQRLLRDRGVPMTVGQALGGAARSTEDRLAGLPFIGDAIRPRRVEGLESFDRAAFDEGLAPIGANTGGRIGQEGIMAAQDATGAAYRQALDGVTLAADAPFAQDMLGAFGQANRLPQEMMSNARDTLRMRVGDNFSYGAGQNGQILPMINGNDFQQSIRGLRRDAASFAPQPYGADFGEVTRSAEGALEGMVQRQAPDVLPAYQNANEAFRNQSVLEKAVLKGLNNTDQGGMFTPAQLGMASRENTMQYGGVHAAARGDMPFNELQQAGQAVLPSRIPDSGTAGRAVIPAVAAALAGGGVGAAGADGDAVAKGGMGLGTGALAAAAIAAPYSRTGSQIIQRALLAERPQLAVQIGQGLVNRSRIAGLLAAPYAVEGYAGQ